MKYKIVQENSTYAMEVKVEELLKNGWSLQGGISIGWNRSLSIHEMYYAQALIR